MDIEATKIELIKLLIHTHNEDVLLKIKEILQEEKGTDFWDDLSNNDKAAINNGLEQLNHGDHISQSRMKKEIKNRFNF